ncbi:MAG: DnaJ C-terminal domain-containing protein [Clostridia bacterium]|nr:DnaJ C-terminal domain-containing protein [Clostridia bacterium]
MIFKDYYKILGLETNQLTMEQIKTAYREQAKKYHPDVNIGDNISEERFKDISEAYRTLSNYTLKKKYDRKWISYVGNKRKRENEQEFRNNSIFNDFSKVFFGDIKQNISKENTIKTKIPQKGENIQTQINISLEEAYYGLNKKISLRAVDGKMKTFSIKIPAGIRNNEKIRLIGQGKIGENGGKNGDLFIAVNIENTKTHRLWGCDLYTDLYLSPNEAALGIKVGVNSIDESIPVCIPEGVQSGEKVRIAGKGYKDGKGGRGDLVAEIKILVPKKLTQEERELYERLNQVSKFEPRKIG